jgi:hypothetical protein
MATENDIIKATVTELKHYYIKQSEWMEIESKQRSSSSPSSETSNATATPSSTPALQNRYASLPVENHVPYTLSNSQVPGKAETEI